ncbi:hypothetical protein ACFVWF_32840 [Rhodococcus qingshengii]|uniref:hypothetical protein n=1 Tax=Rhodococcus qingshengii TaxID=334542 RepID=UPI0036DC8883
MSEIRSQATAARDELDEKIQRWLTSADKIASAGFSHQKVRLCESMGFDWHETIAALQKALPRTVNSAAELDALPEDTVIRVQKRKGVKFATYYEKIHRNMWLALDPGDRSDGEDSWDALFIVRFNEAITVLFTPGDAA